ncbi:MAG: GerMN domain-containing protein [Armatimonadetes bacterium]|nr:GerMN domain-containing protein [Armatimonadota bacterium]
MKTRGRTLILLMVTALLAGCRTSPKSEPVKPAPEPQPKVASVYFANTGLSYMEAEARDTLAGGDPTVQATAAVKELLAGPQEDGHARVIPKDTKLLGLSMKDKTATVDLSSAFTEKFQGGSNVASMAVYSLVNTVTAVDGIEQVLITVEGKPVPEFGGALSLAEPLRADRGLIGGEKLGK